MATTLLPPTGLDTDRDALAALAASCAHRPLVYALVKADLERWHMLSTDERAAALARARRWVDAVVPHPSLDFGG
ncbi:hypothetical protein EON82_19805 [bacterium]|nr:MAG: hypothetical protein EON82_19805 [bacterium]